MTPPPIALGRLEAHLGRLLVVGVTVSAVILAAGLALWLAPRRARRERLLNTGLVVLMATPMLRVLVSVVEYVRMRDWFFATITLVVIAS